MRPLFFEEADNSKLYDYSATYLWGNDMLVSPILEVGKKEQEIYFPKGSNWFDFYSDEKLEGGQTKTVQLNAHYIPTYIRAGAFIPMAKPMQSTKDYDAKLIELHYCHDDSITTSERQYFFDDGKTINAFEKGNYEILEFKAERDGRWLNIELKSEMGSNYSAETKSIELVIHNLEDRPKRIKVNGQEVVLKSWNAKTKTLGLILIWNTSEAKEIRIELK